MMAGLLVVAGCAADAAGTVPADEKPASPAHTEQGPLVSWSFEPASANCNGWPTSGADGIRASPSRTGAYSCKVCSNGSATELAVAREVGGVAPGRYVLRAWVRSRISTRAPAEVVARIDASTARGPIEAVTPPAPVRAEWAPLETMIDLESGAESLRISIGGPSGNEPDRCLFVDDVTLTRE